MIKKRVFLATILVLTLSSQNLYVFASENQYTNSNISISKDSNLLKDGWINENNKWYYILNGVKSTSWQKIDNFWYYFQPSGIMTTNWLKINNYWYYLNENGEMLTNWSKINNIWYYFNDNGEMQIGWKLINDHWYYFNDNGEMCEGWKLINNEWYYFNEDGSMTTEWKKINNEWYYFSPNGPMTTGWQFINNEWYYLNENGTMSIGWKNLNNEWYFLDNNGIMARNSEKTINGYIYKFDSNGIMITDKWFDSTYVNKDGIVLHSSPSKSHSYTQYKLFNYMSYESNRESVHQAAIDLHGGETTNNCVYFTSEALRRAGVNIPLYVANTYQLERELLSRGWKKSTNISDLKPGDIVFSSYKHAFTFMNWYDKDYAYIVDNQKKYFGSVLHKRLVSVDDPINDTIRATHFFYLPK